MSTNNMLDFFDNILDDAGPIGELPDLDQVPEFVDDESKLSPPGQNEEISHGTGKASPDVDLTDQHGRPILVNPSHGGILDKLDGEILSDGFPTFDFDTAIKETDEQDITFESALNEVNHIGIEGENFQSDGDKHSGGEPIEANVPANNDTINHKASRSFADFSCEEDVPSSTGAIKRRKPDGRKSRPSANGPSPSKKARVAHAHNVMNPRVSDVTASSVTNGVPTASDANVRNSSSSHRSLGQDAVGIVHLNRPTAMPVRNQPLHANIPRTGGPIVSVSHNKPPGLTLASHMHPAQHRSAVLQHQLLSPVSPLGMLPGDMRDQLLNQARRQSYASAEMRALMLAQEAASNMYKKASSGDAQLNHTNQNTPISSTGMQAMQPVLQVSGAHPRAAVPIPSVPNAAKLSLQSPLHSVPSQRPVISNHVAASAHVQTTQMHAASNAFQSRDVPFPRVLSTDSHAKQMLLQQHPAAMGLSSYTHNSDPKLPANADSRRLINSNGLHQQFSQTAPYPIIDTKLAAMNGIAQVGPSGTQRVPKETRHSEAVAKTLANTYDQVNRMSSTTVPGGNARRQSQEQIVASSSQGVPVPNLQQRPQQEVQRKAVTPAAAPSTAAPSTPDPTQAGMTAADVRRQLSQNRNGPRLRFSKNAGASKYCHICGRSSSTVSVAVCGNLPIGLCRKVLCEKCLLIHEPEKLKMAKTKGSGWTCTHCRNVCPPKARCHQYTRNNQKRREKNDQKKRFKRKLQQEQEQQEQESKRRRAGSSSEQPEEQEQGISPTGVPDGAFG